MVFGVKGHPQDGPGPLVIGFVDMCGSFPFLYFLSGVNQDLGLTHTHDGRAWRKRSTYSSTSRVEDEFSLFLFACRLVYKLFWQLTGGLD